MTKDKTRHMTVAKEEDRAWHMIMTKYEDEAGSWQKRRTKLGIGGPAQYIGFFEKKPNFVPPYFSVSKILKPDRP